MKKIKFKVMLLLVLYWLPFLCVFVTYEPISKIENLEISDAVIVFGTMVKEDKVSALLKERLDTSIAIYEAKKVKKIVLSNTKRATHVMYRYLLEQSISSSDIELDISAVRTPDSCRYEKEMFSNTRKLIFLSQGYHLPRIQYQCEKIGIKAHLFPAENIQTTRATLFSSFTIFKIRVQRYFREAGLMVLAFLGVYR